MNSIDLWSDSLLNYVKYIYENLYLVETNGIESEAQVEKANGNTIQNAEEHHSFHVNRLTFEHIEALCHMKSAECYHQMPTSECCSCTQKNKAAEKHENKSGYCKLNNYGIKRLCFMYQERRFVLKTGCLYSKKQNIFWKHLECLMQ